MDKLGQVATSLTASKQHLTTSSAASKAEMSLALYHSKLILGCYRTDSVSDPQVYVTAVAAVISRYPSDIGARLSDPKDGIAGRIKWLPSVSEIREACEAMQIADVAAAKRQADLTEQFRLREERERLPPPRLRAYVSNYDDACAKHGRPMGPFEKIGDDWNIKRGPAPTLKPREPWSPISNDDLLAHYGSRKKDQPASDSSSDAP